MLLWLTSQGSWVLNKKKNQAPSLLTLYYVIHAFHCKTAILTVKAAAAAKVAES